MEMNVTDSLIDIHEADISASITLIGDLSGRQREHELWTRLRYGRKYDPQKHHGREPGDKYITIGALAGAIAGGLVGHFIGYRHFELMNFYVGVAIGVVLGGVIGATLGNMFKKYRNKREKNKSELHR